MKQLIRKILREETLRNLSLDIEELLQPIVDKHSRFICGVQAFQDVMNPKKYSLRVIFIGGAGSKNWPMTQAVRGSTDNIMNEMWDTVYNFMGIPLELNSITVKECKESVAESLDKSEITERCWKGYTQKGMKTMFGKRYPNCVKVKNENINETSDDRFMNLLDNYMSMSYPDAIKIEMKLPDGSARISTLMKSKENVDADISDEEDILIHKFEVHGKADYKINKEFFNTVKSMFGGNKSFKKILHQWYDSRPVDEDLLNSKKNMNEESLANFLKKIVSSTRPNPKRDFQKVVDLITRVTLREVPVEGLIGVQVVDIQKSMWGVNYMNDKDKGRRWDFTVVLRFIFESEKDYEESDKQIIKFKDEFINNAYGMGLMNTSPITNKKVKDYKVNFLFDVSHPFILSQQL